MDKGDGKRTIPNRQFAIQNRQFQRPSTGGTLVKQISRRRFIRTSAAAGAVALTFPIRRVLGANEAINMGFLGVGGRGTYSAEWFSKIKDIRVATVCDADTAHLAACKNKFPAAKGEQDLRKVLEDKSIDVVTISTCNHWHALA